MSQMWRNPAQRWARAALRKGDVDWPLDDADARIGLICSRVEGKILSVAAGGAASRARWSSVHRSVRSRIAKREKNYDRRVKSADAEQVVMDAWVELGLRERLSVLTVPPTFHAVVMVAFLSFDYYLFAQAAADLEGTRPSFSNTTFLVGGLFGSVVFVVGCLLALAARRDMSVAYAQKTITRDSPEGAQLTILKERTAGLWQVLGLLLLFGGLCILGLGLRLQADEEVALSWVGFQVAVPVAAFALEYAFRDPTVIADPRRGLVLHALDRIANWADQRAKGAVRAARSSIRTLEALRAEAIQLAEVALRERSFTIEERIVDPVDDEELRALGLDIEETESEEPERRDAPD